MNGTIDITSPRLINWVNTIRKDDGVQYDELIDFYISSAHPSIPDGQAVIIYTGYSYAQGTDEQQRQFISLEDFFNNAVVE